MMGNISCANFLGGVARGMRARLGLGPTAAGAATSTAAPAKTGAPAAGGTQNPDYVFWNLIDRLGWATGDAKVLTDEDVWDWLEDVASAKITATELLNWMLAKEGLARQSHRAMDDWDGGQIFSLIAFGRDTFGRVLEDFSFAVQLDGNRQAVDLFLLLQEEAMGEQEHAAAQQPSPGQLAVSNLIPQGFPQAYKAAEEDDDDD